MKKNFRLGTRGSPLALVQAQTIRKLLLDAHPDLVKNGLEIEIVPIKTTGDWRPEQRERTFLDMGGNKGLFTKEIEDDLLDGGIDLAVHSMKDVPTWIPDGLEFVAMPERADPRDAFISRKARSFEELPQGACVGTSSLRRQSQILARRPDLRVTPLRGNVDTRLRKIEDGEADATILAVAGLTRLGMLDRAASVIDAEIMLPSVAQGAIGVEIRSDDAVMRRMLATINSPDTMRCVSAERALLTVLDGSCRTPIAALAQLSPDKLTLDLDALVAKPDGSAVVRMQSSGNAADAEKIGSELGEELKRKLPEGFY